jgi:hypothetical protein
LRLIWDFIFAKTILQMINDQCIRTSILHEGSGFVQQNVNRNIIEYSVTIIKVDGCE